MSGIISAMKNKGTEGDILNSLLLKVFEHIHVSITIIKSCNMPQSR